MASEILDQPILPTLDLLLVSTSSQVLLKVHNPSSSRVESVRPKDRPNVLDLIRAKPRNFGIK